MNITHILHPELVLNHRGEPRLRSLIRQLLDATGGDHQADVNGRTGRLDFSKFSEKIAEHLKRNPREIRSYMGAGQTYKRFLASSRDIFFVPKSFCESMVVMEKGISLEALPKSFLAYFAFPEETFITPDGDSINGAYVDLATVVDGNGKSKTQLEVIIVTSMEKFSFFGFAIPILDGSTISESFESGLGQSSSEMITDSDWRNLLQCLVNALINAVLFVKLEERNVLPLKSGLNLSVVKARFLKNTQGGFGNLTSLPIKILNFDAYHRPHLFLVDISTVEATGQPPAEENDAFH